MSTQKEIATRTAQSGATVLDLINQMKPAFQAALGNTQMAERFVRVALTLMRTNPKLVSCSQMSLMGSLMMTAQLKLELNLGEAYIIPYWSSKIGGYEAQFQIGYKGFINLFYRHPLAQELYAEVVYANDEFRVLKGTKREIIHVPDYTGEQGKPTGFYAVSRLKSGAYNFAYMSVADVVRYKERYARKDKAGRYGVWEDNFEEMALKTVIKKVLKLMPLSIELASAVAQDEMVKRPVTVEMAADIDSVPGIFPTDDLAGQIAAPEAEAPKPDPVPVKETPKKKKAPTKEEIAAAHAPRVEDPDPYEEQPPLPEEYPGQNQSKPAKETPNNAALGQDKRDALIADIDFSKAPATVKKQWIKAAEDAEHMADVYALDTEWSMQKKHLEAKA